MANNRELSQFASFVSSDSGRVGINTDTFPDARDSLIVAPPSGQTDVFFTIKTLSTNGNTRLQFADPDDTNVGDISYTHSNNVMAFKTSDTERLRIASDGKVGIATNSADRTLDVNGTVITNVTDLGDVTGITTLNFRDSNNFVLTLTGTTTFADPTGIATGQSGVIVLKQDGTGSRTATFHQNFFFKAGTAPTLSVGAGKSDAIAYYCFEPPYIIAGTFIGIGTQ